MTPDPAPEHFRAFARRPINLRARLASGGDHPLDEPARLVDLGLGGAQLELGFAPPNGLRLSIALQVPAPCGPLVLDGEVAWSRTLATGVRVGVRFHHRSGAALRELCELLETDELR